MHLRLDDLRKQARMLQMYEWERTRTRSAEGKPSQGSRRKVLRNDVALGAEIETYTSLTDPSPALPID